MPAVCQFPIGPDAVCGELIPVASSPKGGAPRKYCGNPKHTALNALRTRRAQLAVVPNEPDAPVTSATNSLAVVLSRLQNLLAEQDDILADVRDAVTVIADPISVSHEIAEARRHADRLIGEAQSAQAAAERRAADLAVQRDQARELQQIAIAAADEAEHERDRAVEHAKASAAECEARLLVAETTTAEARKELLVAQTARARAEAERDSALASAEAARGRTARLRDDLDTQLRVHHQQLEQLHADHADALASVQASAADDIRTLRELFSTELANVRTSADARHDEDRTELATLRRQLAGRTASVAKTPKRQ